VEPPVEEPPVHHGYADAGASALVELAEFIASDEPVEGGWAALEQAGLAEGEFAITVHVPVEAPTLHSLVDVSAELERRLAAALLLAYLGPEGVSGFHDLKGLVREYQSRIPLVVSSVSTGSFEFSFKGSEKDFEKVVGRSAPPSLRKRLVKSLAVFFAGGAVMFGATQVALPQPSAGMRKTVEHACEYLPPGAEVTVKVGLLEVKVPCQAPP